MDLSLPLMGILSFIGYNLNKEIDSREYTEKRSTIPSSEIYNGTNVYENKDYVKIKAQEQETLNKFFNDKYTVTDTNRHMTQNDYLPGTDTNKILNGPMFNGNNGFSPKDSTVSPYRESFNPTVSQLSGLATDFSHTNMQPFYSGRVKGIVDSTSVLDKYTGRKFIEKKEKFEPLPTNKQQVNGMLDTIDRSRFNSGLIRNNDLPFDQIRDQYIRTETLRTEEKTVDDLRPLSKPKAGELEARINHGKFGTNRPVEPNYVKNKNNTTFSGDSVGFYPTFLKNKEAGINRDLGDVKRTKKNIMESQYNTGGGFRAMGDKVGISNEEKMDIVSFHQGSSKTELKNNWSSAGKNLVQKRDYNLQDRIVAYEQERETTDAPHIGNAFSKVGDVVRTLDKPRVTNKQLTSYSYVPSAKSQVTQRPRSRYEKSFLKTKPHSSYTPGGSRKFSPQVVRPYVSSKKRPSVGDYYGGAATLIQTGSNHLGDNTLNGKHRQMETDFSYRIGN